MLPVLFGLMLAALLATHVWGLMTPSAPSFDAEVKRAGLDAATMSALEEADRRGQEREAAGDPMSLEEHADLIEELKREFRQRDSAVPPDDILD